ncbi:class A beta-lactamase [Paludibacterium paludis]|uniref:Beta-lactamase n=1 Tax=Paludibacterium paludis TaxID=1225769 RepID=A0A918UBD5_9NEIS|nr:class A beta-lactamase [Paludibacterium paludis]GGY22317.1 beta-lactamase [Paludibacterium paludis]
MNSNLSRRQLLRAIAVSPLIAAGGTLFASPGGETAQLGLAHLEKEAGGRLGVMAIDTGSGAVIAYRARERFPMCSTFKAMLAAALLARSASEPGLLDRQIELRSNDLAPHSPVTQNHLGEKMRIDALLEAMLGQGDNTATNLIMKHLGGTAAVTAYARSLDDTAFHLDRWEPEMNSAIPGDERDTTTPEAMAISMRKLLLGDALGNVQRGRLRDSMQASTTGGARIRAGVPPTWRVADRTGSGYYGTTNAIGVAWPPVRAPIVMAIYFTQPQKAAPWRNDIVASAARLVAETFGERPSR